MYGIRKFVIAVLVVNILAVLPPGYVGAVPPCKMEVPFSECFTGIGCIDVARRDCPKIASRTSVTGNYRPFTVPNNSCHTGGKAENFCDVWDDSAICFITRACVRIVEPDRVECAPLIGNNCGDTVVSVIRLGTYDECNWSSGF